MIDPRLTISRAPPGISIHDYLQRLATHATLSPPILLSMVYYIDRICALYPAFVISSLTVHRFLIASATVASKGLSDSFWTNATYARVGGISLRELALLEMEFLVRVQWRIVPKPEVLVDYYRSLIERSDGYVLESPSASLRSPRSPGSLGASSSGASAASGSGSGSGASSRESSTRRDRPRERERGKTRERPSDERATSASAGAGVPVGTGAAAAVVGESGGNNSGSRGGGEGGSRASSKSRSSTSIPSTTTATTTTSRTSRSR